MFLAPLYLLPLTTFEGQFYAQERVIVNRFNEVALPSAATRLEAAIGSPIQIQVKRKKKKCLPDILECAVLEDHDGGEAMHFHPSVSSLEKNAALLPFPINLC